ncbi:hypothetical protein HPB50_019513 [Hyalomma asiaticum]|uniref:Uncharacterized protein n=1 Tax=Hyalomma asiaticum TaxID=266040 RepID=A0ACB7T0C6_HYAAI|nr:hypothetical protein HPB50_019513 [Hyalomma asiaticum]
MSSRTEVRRNLLGASKKKTDGQRQSSRPLENKKFYFHFKNRRPPQQLTQDLTSLGARVEPFFGKDISCVITDQQDLRPASTPPKPNSVDSSGPSTSPSVFNVPSASTGRSGDPKSSLHSGRGQALVRKAMQNVSGSTDVLELCRQWQIEVCYIKSFLPWLQKLKEKAILENARHGKENAISKQIPEPPQKLVPPFIKIEDMQGRQSARKDHPNVAKQSGFSGTISALRHLKVVRKEPAPVAKNLEAPAAESSHLRRPVTFSNFETQAVVKKDVGTLPRCSDVRDKRSECTLPPGTSRPRKRPATFSEFETKAIVKRDAHAVLCCSDVANAKNECVPPSFSSEFIKPANKLLVALNVGDSNSESTPVTNAANVAPNTSEVFDKALEELFSDSSTLEYSWTDVVSGVVPEPTPSRKQCDEALNPENLQPTTQCGQVQRSPRVVSFADAAQYGLASGFVATV